MLNWFKSFVEYFQFLNYPKCDVKEQQRLIIKRSQILFYSALLMLGIIFVVYLLDTGVIPIDLYQENRDYVIVGTVLLILLILVGIVCYSRGLWKYAENIQDLKNSSQLFEDLELGIKSDYLGLCKQCEHFSDSVSLIEKSIGDFCETHNKFVNFYKKSTKRDPEDLDYIRTDYNKYDYARLFCVFLNPEYFETSDVGRLSDLCNYFLSFYIKINSNKKLIRRVFCKSSIVERDDPNKINSEKAVWMFQYILCNYIAGVEICYLINEEQLKCQLDYVIGKFNNEKQLCPTRKYYFSINEGEHEKQVESNDQLFFNILDKDFYQRWYGDIEITTMKTKKYIKRERYIVERDELHILKEIFNKLNLKDYDLKRVFDNVQGLVQNCGKLDVFQDNEEVVIALQNRFNTIKSEFKKVTSNHKKHEI